MATPNRYAQRAQRAPAAARPTPERRPGTPARETAPPSRPASRRPWLLAGATLSALALGVPVINHLTTPDPNAPQGGCLINVDAQGSASAMVGAYRRWLPSQAKDCAAADRATLSIALVSGETRTSTVIPVTTDLRSLDFTGNSVNDETIVNNEIDRVVKEADQAILAAPKQQGGTDILGVMCVAHDLLHGHSPSTLIIDSDGINNREPYRLSKVPLDEASIAKYVDQLKADGQLCDLTGTQVHMYGVGIGSGTSKLSLEQLTGIQRFWEAVVRATGAELVDYQRNP